MHYRENENDEDENIPFDVVCTSCGSHNVAVTAFDRWDLGFKCNRCGSYLSCGRYNPLYYKGE